MKNLFERLEEIEATGPKWALVITDAKSEAHPPAGTVSNYIDKTTELRVWFLSGDTAEDLADAQQAIDQLSKSGIPDLPGATITLQTANGPVTGSLKDFLQMADLLWQVRVARELGLFDRAEQLQHELDLLATAADYGLPLTAEQIKAVEEQERRDLESIGLVETVRKAD